MNIEEIQKQHLEAMIDYKKITKIDVGQVHFTPEMVIQACKDSVKAAIPLILEIVSEKAKTNPLFEDNCSDHTPFRGACGNCGNYHNYKVLIGEKINKESITFLQETLEKQLGI